MHAVSVYLISQDVFTMAISILARLPLKIRGDRVQVRDLILVVIIATASRL